MPQPDSLHASPSLAGRVALVTGGTGALGRWVVHRLVEAGAQVHATWRSESEVGELQDLLGRFAAHVVLHQVDVSQASAVTSLFDGLRRDSGRLDILACIAGGFSAAPVESTPADAWDRMMVLNATSAFLCCRAAVPLMKAGGGGRIVTVAARPALERGAAGMSAYAASKAAVLNLTYSLAKELVRDRITVNALIPSTIDTPANRAAMPKADTTTWLKPDEIAAVVVFLASDAGGVVTGSAVNLSRG